MQWKGELPEGAVYDKPVWSLDIFATAAGVSGAILDDRKRYDGVNLIPYLKNEDESAPHQSLFWRVGTRAAIRVGDWKLLRNPRRGQGDQWELYNLANDISESNDLSATHPEKRAELLDAWNAYNDQMIDPVWTPN